MDNPTLLLGIVLLLVLLIGLIWRVKAQRKMRLVVTFQRQVSEQLFIVRLRRPWWCRMIRLPQFQGGQAVSVQIPSEDARRYYSLAQWQAKPREYELAIKREPYGRFSPRLCGYARVGAKLIVEAPQGGFVLRSNVQRRAVLIASGIGITPLLAMYQQWQASKQRAYAQLFCYWQVRYEQDALYREALGYQARILYSRPSYGKGQHLTVDLLQQELGALNDCDFYLCGSPSFMASMRQQLKQANVSSHAIISESFQGLSGGDCQHIIHYQGQRFSCSGYGNILSAIEAQGLRISSDCRSGFCGCCEIKLEQGRASHFIQPEYQTQSGHILSCCALPESEVWLSEAK